MKSLIGKTDWKTPLMPSPSVGVSASPECQEQIVRGFLNLDEVRHLQHFTDFAIVFTQTFLAKEGLRHVSMSPFVSLAEHATTGAVMRAHKSG